MDYDFDIAKFKKYFHYGLDYKQEDILDAIIIRCSKVVNNMGFEEIRGNMNELEYTIDMAKGLYVQFIRFIDLAGDKNKHWYKNVNKETIHNEVIKRIGYLKKNDLISVVNYKPIYGIYATDRIVSGNGLGITGMQRYSEIQGWIKDDMMPVLEYLSKLEHKNPYQYNSLFLDTKYARSVNSGNKDSMKKIESLYTSFLEMVKPAKQDVYKALGENISSQDKKKIEENCADYWTITDLKEQAQSEKYKQKVKAQCENIKTEKER